MPKILLLITLCAVFLLAAPAQAENATADKLARDILSDLVATNTAPSGGYDTRSAVAGLVARLEAAGFREDEISIVGQTDKLQNLVVRYRSEKAEHEPVLLMAHLDVVEALAEDWTLAPYELIEKDGYYYGRGTTDNKAGAAILVANFIRLRKEGFKPNRDLIVMLTADEESTQDATLWLTTEQRALIDAKFALNTDAGLVMLKDDQPRAFIMQTSEKIYVSFTLEALDPGGHSSLPRADSAIRRLARALVDFQDYEFPVDLNETTRAFFTEWSELASPSEQALIATLLEGDSSAEFLGRLAKSPYYNALARTTCVATQLNAGHAENALPQSARAVINCRVVPQSSAEHAQEVIESIVSAHGVTVKQIAVARPSPASPLDASVLAPIKKVADELWPGIPLIPEMSTGATDGLFVRNAGIPVYGVSAIAEDPDDIRAHGQDERIRIDSYQDATEYWYRLTREVAGGR